MEEVFKRESSRPGPKRSGQNVMIMKGEPTIIYGYYSKVLASLFVPPPTGGPRRVTTRTTRGTTTGTGSRTTTTSTTGTGWLR